MDQGTRAAYPTRPAASLDHSDRVSAADCAHRRHLGVDTHVSFVLLGCGSQDPRIVRKVSLAQSRHHTAWTRSGDLQTNLPSDGECAADPSVLDETLFTLGRLHNDIRPESPDCMFR